MFGSRRNRPQHPPPLTTTTANPSAATAALAVFNRTRDPTVSLSSAAAAAALKARPTTPTNVAEVQTKRTMRRSGSVSSSGTGELQHRPDLQRRGSQGSMTERTFRSPSPHRPGSSGSAQGRRSSFGSATPIHEAPPVPSIPKTLDTRSSASGQHAKSSSVGSLRLGSPPLRLASQSLGAQGQGTWFGAASGDPSNVRTSDAAMAPSPSQIIQGTTEGRSPSRSSSVNFSYPSRLRVGSPPASPMSPAPDATAASSSRNEQRTEMRRGEEAPDRRSKRLSSESGRSQRPSSISSEHSLVYDPNSRRMVPRTELLAIDQAVRDASEKSTRPRKKKQTPPKTGTHLSQGTVARAHGTAVTGSETASDVGSRDVDSSPPSVVSASQVSRGGEVESETAKDRVVSPTPAAPRPSVAREQRQPGRASPVSPVVASPPRDSSSLSAATPIRRMPSVVKEEPELELEHDKQSEEASPAHQSAAHAVRVVPIPEDVAPTAGPAASEPKAEPRIVPSATTAPPPAPEPAKAREPPSTGGVVAVSGQQALARSQSETQSHSPVRAAHFGPVQQEGLMVRHSPPPRSVSPMKPALKPPHSPPRGASPSDNSSEASGPANSREETLTRKKSVRVSFDDENTVVVPDSASLDKGEALPAAAGQSPRRPWYSNIGRNKRKDMVGLDDDDVVMQPRPALPSFGSVRDKKPREPEDRPLVRPSESAYSPPRPASPSVKPAVVALAEPQPQPQPQPPDEPLGQSSDQAVGAILLQDQRERNEANISKYREPLPPVVTSIEGDGYVSDASSTPEYTKDTTREDDSLVSTPNVQPEAAAAEVVEKPIEKPAEPVAEPVAEPAAVDVRDFGEEAVEQVQEPKATEESAVPSISVSEPEPSPYEQEPTIKSFFTVPGSFPEEESDASTIREHGDGARDTPTPPAADPAVVKQDATARLGPPAGPAGRRTPADESDTEPSVYSDAYEDLSDLEEGGFQSLDAVVDSPVATQPRPAIAVQREATPTVEDAPTPVRQVPTQNIAQVAAVPVSPSPAAAISQPQEAPADDWERAKAYWKTLSADRRAQLERETREEEATEADMEQDVDETKQPKKKKSVERRNSERRAIQERAQAVAQQKAQERAQELAVQQQAAQRTAQQASTNPNRSYQIKPGTKAEDPYEGPQMLRSTMRDRGVSQPTAVAATGPGPERNALRKSMRTDTMPRSSQAVQSQPAPLATNVKPRVMSMPATASYPGESKSSSPPASTGMKSFFPPALKRRGSESSESSFRRARPVSGEGFGFRHTLRSSTQPQGDNVPRAEHSGKFSMRSKSPPVSMATGIGMRRTLRDNSADQSEGKSRLHMPSFARSAGAKKRQGSGSKFSSRFGNSSDEEDAPAAAAGSATGRFRSRFDDDSSDDDARPATAPRSAGNLMQNKTMRRGPAVAQPASPVQQLQQRRRQQQQQEEEESEELPDSDDEKPIAPAAALPATRLSSSRTPNIGTATLQRNRSSGRGDLTLSQTAPVMRPTSPTRPAPQGRRSSLMAILRRKKPDASAKIQRPELMDSAARRDTNLERSARELTVVRQTSGGVGVGGRPTSPKLQKRNYRPSTAAPTVAPTGSWPLPAADNTQEQQQVEKEIEKVPEPEPEQEQKQEAPAELANQQDEQDDIDEDEKAAMENLRRSTTASANLGTRTLSGSGVAGRPSLSGPQRPVVQQRRTLSSGAGDVLSVGSAGGDAQAGVPKKKKKFGALRRMFRLDE